MLAHTKSAPSPQKGTHVHVVHTFATLCSCEGGQQSNSALQETKVCRKMTHQPRAGLAC